MKRALVVFSMLVPALALAQPQTGDKVDAQSLMQSGVKLFEAKDYLGALAVFKTAYERFPSGKILLNIGTTLKLLGRDADAANAYQRYLDARDADPKRQGEIAKLVDKLDKTVGRYDIAVTPSDAQVHIDDDDWLHIVRGKSWRVTPGRHSIEVKRDGFVAKTTSVEVAAGEAASLEINLVATPVPTAVITEPVSTGIRATAVVDDGPRSRFGALVFGHFDIPHGGAALVGLTGDVNERIAVRAAAILGPHFGGYAGVAVAILTHRYRPYVTGGVPVFVSNGARYGVRGAAGF
jgi:hypothetical protein